MINSNSNLSVFLNVTVLQEYFIFRKFFAATNFMLDFIVRIRHVKSVYVISFISLFGYVVVRVIWISCFLLHFQYSKNMYT